MAAEAALSVKVSLCLCVCPHILPLLSVLALRLFAATCQVHPCHCQSVLHSASRLQRCSMCCLLLSLVVCPAFQAAQSTHNRPTLLRLHQALC